jgi:hypothetical protein
MLTLMVTLEVLEQPRASVTCRTTVYVPFATYVCDGFWLADVAPSPKVQEKVLLLVWQVFVKLKAPQDGLV